MTSSENPRLPEPTRRRRSRDGVAIAILTLLALSGLIPWVGVLRGGAPAYTAELGAVVTLGALLALALTLRDAWRSAPDDGDGDGDDENDEGSSSKLH